MPEALQKLENRPVKFSDSERIQGVKFVESETGDLQVSALMKDGTSQTIHVFNPQTETWRQFEFDGLTLSQAKNLIDSRKNENG